jgi:hypothetical protein
VKYLRTYEDRGNTPNLGDYVITKVIISDDIGPELRYFLENTIGKINQDNGNGRQQYLVKYEVFYNVLSGFTVSEWWFDKTEILFSSSDEKETISILPYIHNVNKYNL